MKKDWKYAKSRIKKEGKKKRMIKKDEEIA